MSKVGNLFPTTNDAQILAEEQEQDAILAQIVANQVIILNAILAGPNGTLYAVFQMQPPSTLAVNPMVENTDYQMLVVTVSCNVLSGTFTIIGGGPAETVKVTFIIDGQTFTGTINASYNAAYYFYLNAAGQIQFQINNPTLVALYSPLQGRSVQILIRKTTNQNPAAILTSTVIYQTRNLIPPIIPSI